MREKDQVGKGGWVYIMSNRPNGTLYTGVTNDLTRRGFEHREGIIGGFTKRYGLTRLVYVERHETTAAAIQREHNIKHWPRRWKVRLVLDANPEWRDLFDEITGFVDGRDTPGTARKGRSPGGGHEDKNRFYQETV
jgi:putative endonuclease